MKAPTPPSFIFEKGKCKSRRGISPVIATTIILAITIALGLGLWGFANSGVGTASVQYSETVDRYGEFVNDRFAIANVDFNNPSSGRLAIWIYNSGKLPTTLDGDNIIVICREAGCTQPTPQPATLEQYDPNTGAVIAGFDVPSKQLRKFSIDITTIQSDKTYELTIVSDTGASQTLIKKSD